MQQSEGSRSPAFTALRRFARPRVAAEQCELCSAEIAPDPHHPHLLDPLTRQILCACPACALLFSTQEATKFKRIPQRVLALPDFRMTDAQWDELLVPVGMAFFFHSSAAGRALALYPGPAGATESLLSLQSWAEIVQANAVLESMAPDVEGLLVNRVKAADGHHREYYLVPIDACYRLVGLIRANWRGLSGGQEVWHEIEGFFSQLRARSDPAPAAQLPPNPSPPAPLWRRERT